MEVENIKLTGKETVRKSNAIARGSWPSGLVWEKRIVNIIASQVRHTDEDFKTYSIPVSEIALITGLKKSGHIYKAIDELTDKAMGRIVRIKEKGKWEKYTLFSMCSYEDGSGELLVRFDPGLKPHYLDLNNHYSEHEIMEILSLRSTYSQDLYDILRSWDDCVVTDIPISELHEMMSTSKEMRKNFYEFKRNALEKATKEINKNTSLKFRWESIKKGKRVFQIRFTILNRPNKKSVQKPGTNKDSVNTNASDNGKKELKKIEINPFKNANDEDVLILAEAGNPYAITVMKERGLVFDN